jgi:EmrB/QacA subfamily drug resistance transporter
MAARSTRRSVLTTIVISMVQFIVVLESLSISVALPAMDADLDLGSRGMTWVLQAYMLGYGGFLGVAGRAADIFGHRRLLLSGLALFGAASLVAGLAADPAMLIAGRLGQGLGAAVILPAAMSLLVADRTDYQKGRALAVWSAVGGAGVVTGAVIGGVVTGTLGWRWLFVGNVVIVVVVAVAARLLITTEHTGERHRLDLIGALLFTSGVAVLLYALPAGEDSARLGIAQLLGVPAGLLLLTAFAWLERRKSDPLIPERVLEARARRAASLGAVALNGGFACILVFGSAQLQQVSGYGAVTAGLALLPLAALAALATEPAARLCQRFRRSRVAVAGLLTMAAGFALLTYTPSDSGYSLSFLPGTIIVGAGISIAYVPLTLLAVGNVPERDRGVASGVYNTFGQVGSAVILAVVTTVAALAPGGRAGAGAITADVVRNAYWAITILLFVGAAVTWLTARRPRDPVIQAPAELLNPTLSVRQE